MRSFLDIKVLYFLNITRFFAKVKRKYQFHGMKLQHQKIILSFLAINLFCFSINAQQHAASSRSGYELSRLKDPATGKIPMDIRLKELAFAQTLPKSIDADGIALRGTPWYHRGPFNIGGRTRAFGIDVANENRLIAGSVSGGMWLSQDNGNTWMPTQRTNELRTATCVAQDTRKNHRNVWIMGSGEAYGQSAGASGAYYLGDGLFISTDSAKSWSQITSTSGGVPTAFSTNWQLIWNIALDPSAPDTTTVIYAATYNNLMKSSDAGKTWKSIKSGGSYFTDVFVTKSGTVYFTMSSEGTNKGIWRSTNGVDFVNITPQFMQTQKYQRIVIGVDPQNENRVYFLANTSGWGKKTSNYKGDIEWNALLKCEVSKKIGGSDTAKWTDLSLNLPSGGPFERWNVQGSYDMFVRVHPADSNVVFIGGTNVFRSKSAFADSLKTRMIGGYKIGAKFPDVGTYPNHHPDQHDLTFYPSNPNKMINANDGGVFRTNNNLMDSIVWESLNNGYLTTQFYTVALDHGTEMSNILIAGAQDNNSLMTNSFDLKSPWQSVYFGDGAYNAIDDGAKNFYLSKQQGKMVKAQIDNSMNRVAYRRIDPIGAGKYQFINPFALDPNNNNIMYLAGGKYLWRNDKLNEIVLDNKNDSISLGWTKAKDSVSLANVTITALHVCKTPANRVYYGASNRKVYRVDSANKGQMIAVDITSNVVLPIGNVSCITADPTNGDHVMVSYSNYGIYSLFSSMDAGKTWTKAAGNLEQNLNGSGNGPSIRWASIVPVENGKIYLVATSTGFFATDTLKGTSTVWVQQASGEIGNMVCDMFDVRLKDGTVALATHGNGIYSARLFNTTDILKTNDFTQVNFSVYPNPSRGEFSIKSDEKFKIISVEILDDCGRLIKRMDQFEIDKNQYSCKSFKTGIYYLRMRLDNGKTITKLFNLTN